MALLAFWLTAYNAADPFTVVSVTVVAANGLAVAEVPCDVVTMQEIQDKKAMLGQALWDQDTLAAICTDKLGVPVKPRVS
jgi:hypothetical protein